MNELTFLSNTYIYYFNEHGNENSFMRTYGYNYFGRLTEMAKRFKDDKFRIIEADIEKMRSRPTMYLSALNSAGCLHVCKEIIDNARDECYKKDSPGDTILIEIFNDHIHVKDNGRGIPIDLLQVVFETNQAGSNMTRSGGETSGENGTGTTLSVAMGRMLIATSSRPQDQKQLTLKYECGSLTERTLDDHYTGTDRGMDITFYPDKKVLGVNKIPVDDLVAWISDMRYSIPNDMNITYVVNGKKHHVVKKQIWEYFDENIPEMSDPTQSKFMCEPYTVTVSGKLTETFLDVEYPRTFNVTASFVYASPAYRGDDIRKSWMNMIYTSQNGVHVDGVIEGFEQVVKAAVCETKKSLEGENIHKDIMSHLQVIVLASCDMAHMFSSQGKHHVFPEDLKAAIRTAIAKEIAKTIPDRTMKQFVDIVIANNRVRKAGEQARDINKQTKTRQWDRPTSYIPCASIKTDEPKELFLVEGISAGGGLRNCRDARYQAILQFRGKSLNIWEKDLDAAMKSEPWLNLIKVLGCGIGPTFDIKKLRFDKIIIATDADIDGYHIRVGFCCFFMKFLPEIITAGKLYISEPPLYALKRAREKDIIYVATQTEYIQKCIDSIGSMKIEFPEK